MFRQEEPRGRPLRLVRRSSSRRSPRQKHHHIVPPPGRIAFYGRAPSWSHARAEPVLRSDPVESFALPESPRTPLATRGSVTRGCCPCSSENAGCLYPWSVARTLSSCTRWSSPLGWLKIPVSLLSSLPLTTVESIVPSSCGYVASFLFPAVPVGSRHTDREGPDPVWGPARCFLV